jgi:hypothetical protein
VTTSQSAISIAQLSEFQARAGRYPDSAVAAPHLFQKVAVPGICID